MDLIEESLDKPGVPVLASCPVAGVRHCVARACGGSLWKRDVATDIGMDGMVFLLNGERIELDGVQPTRTLLDWLRDTRGLRGTKEGCNEGDCGACTVMVTDAGGTRAMNACILFLPQIHGKAVRTVEGIAGPEGRSHPVQRAMVECHGSQCGFCTPGFVVSMAVAHLNGQSDFDDRFAGNLCRCTGYAPIVRAARKAAAHPVPEWLSENLERLGDPGRPEGEFQCPRTADELASWYVNNRNAVLVAGATDVGLWITKGLQAPERVAFLGRIGELRSITETDDGLRVGALASIADLGAAIGPLHPDLAELVRRFGSIQIRGAATVGGNIANGSPIGDTPPALIALGATLHLREGEERRSMPLEEFFLDYGRQDRRPGEFVEAVTIPRQPDRLKCYKLSKRFDQDISTVCGCFSVAVSGGVVTAARIAFGGMAGIPKRATHMERALVGQPWTEKTVRAAREAVFEDFTPIDDMRGSASYRLNAAGNLLMRYWFEQAGVATRVLEVPA